MNLQKLVIESYDKKLFSICKIRSTRLLDNIKAPESLAIPAINGYLKLLIMEAGCFERYPS